MIDLVGWLLLGFAAYRITRILVIDSIIDGSRAKLHNFLLKRLEAQGRLRLLWDKLLDLTSCTFCVGVWVSLALFSLWIGTYPFAFDRQEWITAFGIMGLQAYLHVLEPDED